MSILHFILCPVRNVNTKKQPKGDVIIITDKQNIHVCKDTFFSLMVET